MTSDDISPATARYLETVFYLAAEGEDVRSTRIAEWLGVSLPTVSLAVRRMVDAGLVALLPSKAVVFTPTGRERAARIVRTHRIVERWLCDELALDWLEADEEAGRLQHAVSDEVAERLYERLGRPTTCPHGNPIPGAPADGGGERPLSGLRAGERARMRRVSEATEHDAPALLRFLADHGFGIGVPIEVVGPDAGSGALTLDVAGRRVAMSTEMARKVWVD